MNGAPALLRRLGELGRWAGRHELAPADELQAADALAALVAAGDVLYNERAREWRLAGGVLARKALAQLMAGGAEGPPRRVLGAQSADKSRMVFGLALRTGAGPDERFTIAEIDMPYPEPAEALRALFVLNAELAAAETAPAP